MENNRIEKQRSGRGKIVIGMAIIVVGVALLLKQLGIYYPGWIVSWPMLLIVIGLANGVKHQFKNSSWFIMVAIGTVFLIEKIVPEFSFSQYWPVALIAIGIWFIFGRGFGDWDNSRKKRFKNRFEDNYQNTPNDFNQENGFEEQPKDDYKFNASTDEFIDSVAVFGGTKKNILSKNFKGGEIVTIMGGTEINLTNADINGPVILDVTQIFGGTKIFIPQTWDISTEMAAIFAGIDDKRSLVNVIPDRSKLLIIKGTSIFGGIEIRNF
jgi:predicted membrane protein